MKKTVFLLLSASLLLGACRPSGPRHIMLANSTGSDRTDEAFTIARNELRPADDNLLPALKQADGTYVPTQIDDLDGDGQWDEMAFVYSLENGGQATLDLVWLAKEDYPAFASRTNVRLGKMFAPGDIRILSTDSHGKYNLPRGKGYPYQTDGPAWENDKMGFRHYFDGRNVRDVFGKRTGDLVLDTVGIRADGTPGDTYHVLNAWGRDIMSGANSVGLGGLALQTPDSLVRLGVLQAERTDNVDSTLYTVVANGPVRSIFRLDFLGWDTGMGKTDVHETMTIWAGKFGYENTVTTSTLPEGCALVTGIVNNFNDKPYTFEQAGRYQLMSTHDRQTYNKEWYMGMSLLIAGDNFDSTFEAPKNGPGITTCWCARLKPDEQGTYRYWCCAAWELTDERFCERDFYEDMVRSYADELSDKIIPVLK